MSRIRLVVNGHVEFDGEPGEWVSQPPDAFADMIKQGTRPEPWQKAVMIIMTDALIQEKSIGITVRTGGGGTHRYDWSMNVHTES